MPNKTIQSIVKALNNDKCVLFLGPNISRDSEGDPVHHKFLREVANRYQDEVQYHEEEGFLFFKEPAAKSDVIYDMMDYYKNNEFSIELLKKIAHIPFHLIVSLTPDATATWVFKEYYDLEAEFVDFEKRTEKDCRVPSADHPVIYSLLGMAAKGNFILSQEDFYEYMKEVISNKRAIPVHVRSALTAARHFLFMGFGFQQWYVRLLMNVLDFHTIEVGKKRQVINFEDTSEGLYRELVERQFSLNFIDQNYDSFIDELLEESRAQGIARSLDSPCERWTGELEQKVNLLNQYQNKRLTENDPKEKMKIDQEISDLKPAIEELKAKIQTNC
jgi:hypothetical protein